MTNVRVVLPELLAFTPSPLYFAVIVTVSAVFGAVYVTSQLLDEPLIATKVHV